MRLVKKIEAKLPPTAKNREVTHRRRSDWNCGGTYGGTYYKSPAIEAKNTFSYIVMQVIWCLKFCNMTKSGGTIPPLQILGDLSPVPPWSTPMEVTGEISEWIFPVTPRTQPLIICFWRGTAGPSQSFEISCQTSLRAQHKVLPNIVGRP